MRWTWRTTCALGLAAATLRCGGPTAAPTPAMLHGEVSDPAGDAVRDARVSVAPDLVRATADVTSGTITFVITLAPGTLDRQSTRVSVLLDSDQNSATGIAEPGGLGADYGLDLVASSGQATVTKADPAGCAAHESCFTSLTSAPLVVSGDSMEVAIPLTTVGSADGRLAFGVSSYVLVAALTTVTFDRMPDVGSARVQ